MELDINITQVADVNPVKQLILYTNINGERDVVNYAKEPKDLRSTGRKRARKVIFDTHRPWECRKCKKSTIKPPPDAPEWFNEMWPKENRVLESTHSLQVQHINKNLMDVDPVNLEVLCASCHKIDDMQTAKGVSLIDDEHGYKF